MVESAVRLIVAIVALVWLPGWLLNSRLGWPRDVVPSLFSGTSLHIVLIFCVTSVTHRVASSTLATLIVTAIVVVLFALRRPVPTRHEVLQERMRPMLWPGVVIGVLVGAAAVMRLFHNYHYDDFQHLVYLTEVARRDDLFPVELMRLVELPTLTQGIYVSRYPLWAAAYAVWAYVTGVPVGDVYYLLGLAVLALSLFMLLRFAEAVAGSIPAALVAILAMLSSSLVVSDDLLNYGGYPFQTGKLFVVIGAMAFCAYLRTRKLMFLVYALSGLLIGPLVHANNIIGSAIIAGIVGAYCLARKQWISGIAIPVSAACVWFLVGLIALEGQSFVKWPSSIEAAPETTARRLPSLELPDEATRGESAAGAQATRGESAAGAQATRGESTAAAVPDRGLPQSVLPLWALFVRRALPLELLASLVTILAHWKLNSDSARRMFVLAATAAAVAILAINISLTTARLVLIGSFKPGFFAHRAALLDVKKYVDDAGVLTDPITAVYGSAAGWKLSTAPALTDEEQFVYLSIFHPSVSGTAVRKLLAEQRAERILVNEAVMGPGVAAKFDKMGARVIWRHGDVAPLEKELKDAALELATALYRLNYIEAVRVVRRLRGWGSSLFLRRSMTLFSLRGLDVEPEKGRRVESVDSLESLRIGDDRLLDQFLSSFLIRTQVPSGCHGAAQLSLTGAATFDGTVLIHVVDEAVWRRIGGAGAVRVFPGETVVGSVSFERPVCGPDVMTFFLHSGYLYDFRFRVESISWVTRNLASQKSQPRNIGGARVR